MKKTHGEDHFVAIAAQMDSHRFHGVNVITDANDLAD